MFYIKNEHILRSFLSRLMQYSLFNVDREIILTKIDHIIKRYIKTILDETVSSILPSDV